MFRAKYNVEASSWIEKGEGGRKRERVGGGEREHTLDIILSYTGKWSKISLRDRLQPYELCDIHTPQQRESLSDPINWSGKWQDSGHDPARQCEDEQRALRVSSLSQLPSTSNSTVVETWTPHRLTFPMQLLARFLDSGSPTLCPSQ